MKCDVEVESCEGGSASVEAEKGMAHKSVTLVDLGNMLYYVQGFDSVRKYHEFAVDHLSYVTDLEAACCS